MDVKEAASFALSSGLSSADNGVMYKISAKSGVDISHVSHQAFTSQKEVVLRRGTKYKITGKSKQTYKLWNKSYSITTLNLEEA